MHSLTSYIRLLRLHMPLAGAALISVMAVRVMLWVLPYRWVLRMAASPVAGPAQPAHASNAPRQRRCAVAVGIASALIPKATCLTQALATLMLLRFRGDDARLIYGVRHGARGNLQAHAWLETDEGVLIGHTADLSTFQPMGGMNLQA